MSLNRDKYDIEVQNGDAIKRNRIFFEFMQRTFNCLDELYLRGRCLLIDAIMKDQLKKQIAEEIEKLNRGKNPIRKIKKGISSPSAKKACLVNKTTQTSRATSNTSNSKFNTNIPQ